MTRRVDIRGRCGGGGLGRQAQPLTCLKSASVNAGGGHPRPAERASCCRQGSPRASFPELEIVAYFAFTYHFGVAGIDGSWKDSVATNPSRNRDTPTGAPTIRNSLGAAASASDVTEAGALNGVQLTPS
jgi:hypothetical protein